jgi:hypothetical protein
VSKETYSVSLPTSCGLMGNKHYTPTLRLVMRHSAHGGHGTLGDHKVSLGHELALKTLEQLRQKRPTVSKETYSVKRDLPCQKRPTVSIETYSGP